MSIKSKEAVFFTLVAFSSLLVVYYFVILLNKPAFVSPETAEMIWRNEGYSVEMAETMRTLCESKGCYFGDDGEILVNQN